MYKSFDSLSNLGLLLSLLKSLTCSVPDCNTTYSGMSGVVLSAFYPNNYMNLGRCEISVTVPINHTIMLVADDFNTELCCDYLEACRSVCFLCFLLFTHVLCKVYLNHYYNHICVKDNCKQPCF